MTRVLWHSAAPWLGTGYGTQTDLFCRYLRDMGHEVAISSYYNSLEESATGAEVRWHDGIKVYPPGLGGDSHENLKANAEDWKAEVIVVLADLFKMSFAEITDIPVLAWMPIDCDPLSLGDTYALLNSSVVRPVAMSEHGQRMLHAAGFGASWPGGQVPLIPHALDTLETWKPDMHRDELRLAFGIPPGWFAIGANYNNIDPIRKATPELFWAFRDFHEKHPQSVLFAHTMVSMPKSIDQRVLARTLGITDFVRFADPERAHGWGKGNYTTQEMVRWYSAMNVVVNATYGEGFGLPAIEAQATGTPVILSDGTTGPQLKGPGWLVPTEPFWNLTHGAWWHRPSIRGITRALNSAWEDKSPFKRRACRVFAEKFDIRLIGPMWSELVEEAPSWYARNMSEPLPAFRPGRDTDLMKAYKEAKAVS